MDKRKLNWEKILIAYYGFLQGLHLLTLARAGYYMFFLDIVPFPILPPPTGWMPQTMPFMLGLAGMDIVGIVLAFILVFQKLMQNKLRPVIGLISLTIFISGAIVFAVGTLPSGAWAAHPLSYVSMVLLFTPTLPLYVKLAMIIHQEKVINP